MSLQAEEQKFSVMKYAGHYTVLAADADERSSGRNSAESRFRLLVEEVRGMLVQPPARGEMERERHHELLNKAVLGYPEERRQVLAVINDYLVKRRINDPAPSGSRFESLTEAIYAEVIGLDVLELILKDAADLEEIQVVGTNIYEIRGGDVRRSVYAFDSVDDVIRLQNNLVLYNQDSFNPRKRWAEVMLRDGSRVTMTGFGYTSEPTLTIRFFVARHASLQDLVKPGIETMDERTAEYLRIFLHSGFNMVVIGPTNSGKTHLIKAMIAELPDEERIITIESRREMMLGRDFPGKNVVEYEIDEQDPKHSAEQAFKLALRQTPKRIIHAEIRDDDANLYVRACTRGHQGSLTTVHVNELEDAPDAITDMCMQDGRGMSPDRLAKRICLFVTQIGIEMAIAGGKRRVIRIGEFGYDNGPTVRDLVRYDHAAGQWLYPSGLSEAAASRIRKNDPEGYDRLRMLGVVRT